MSAKDDKKTRRIAGKYKKHIANDMMRDIMQAPFKTRIAFAWMVVKGVVDGNTHRM